MLVQAALSGVPQVKREFRDDADGRCALGVLMDSLGLQFGRILGVEPGAWNALEKAFDISIQEQRDISVANDNLGWDFLTIARKIGNPEEANG